MSFLAADQVIDYTGVKPSDLGFGDDAELEAWLDTIFPAIDDLINTYVWGTDIERHWDDGSVPSGVVLIAQDMARNAIMTMIVSRETPVVSMGDMKARVLEPNIFTKSIKDALDIYKGTSSARPSWRSAVRMFRVRREDEMPDE